MACQQDTLVTLHLGGSSLCFWDVLVLFRDLFHALSANVAVMERLLASPPGKFLELGTKQLLTEYFQGGKSTSGGDTQDKQEREEQGDMDIPALSPKGSWLLEDSERDLIKKDHRAEV